METDLPYAYLHLRLFLSVVATTTFLAMWWAAHHRRGGARISGRVGPLHILAILAVWLFMHLYVLLIFHIPALLLLYIPWAIASASPLVHATVAESEAISGVAALLSIGANFADVASTYSHRGFWAHIAQFSLVVAPIYYGMVAIVWVLTRLFSNLGWSPDYPSASALRLLVPTVRASSAWLDAFLIVVLLLAIGAGSYTLRILREKRGGFLMNSEAGL